MSLCLDKQMVVSPYFFFSVTCYILAKFLHNAPLLFHHSGGSPMNKVSFEGTGSWILLVT